MGGGACRSRVAAAALTVPEYTIAATAAAVITVWMDLRALRTRVVADRRMPVVGALVVFFMVITNGWLTSRPIVVYDDAYRLLPRVGTIPIEDFLFGFALVVQTLIWWEVAKRGAERRGRPAPQRQPCASPPPRPGP